MGNISISLDSGILKAYGRDIKAWCLVRNELNGERKLTEKAVYSQEIDGDSGVPYMPRTFPVGTWNITGIIPHPDHENDGYLYPYFIATDAHQKVERWETDEKGRYVRPTGIFVEDYGYGLHFSTSRSTLGCIRIAAKSDLLWLVARIKEDRDAGGKISVTIQVD